MKRILTGIQSSGKPHLGNLLGALLPAVALSQTSGHQSYFFIADMHALTTVKNPAVMRENVLAVAAAWLACGFDVEKNCLYRQSRVPQVCELMWCLNCVTPYPMLANAHSFKDKLDRLSEVNTGLFTYPVLMAADIILYDAHIVPVGKDQKQHVEIARDIATAFNRQYGDTFVIPEAKIEETVMTIPGTDGQKMSKSYGNTIDIFLPEKELRKQIMSIMTDSAPLEAPKNPEGDTVYTLYKLLASPAEAAEMKTRYLAGNYGYGHAKQALFEKILERFSRERAAFAEYVSRPEEIEKKLKVGEAKAAQTASATLRRVRDNVGFS